MLLLKQILSSGMNYSSILQIVLKVFWELLVCKFMYKLAIFQFKDVLHLKNFMFKIQRGYVFILKRRHQSIRRSREIHTDVEFIDIDLSFLGITEVKIIIF